MKAYFGRSSHWAPSDAFRILRHLDDAWSLHEAADVDKRAIDAARDAIQVSVKKEPCLHTRRSCIVARELDHEIDASIRAETTSGTFHPPRPPTRQPCSNFVGTSNSTASRGRDFRWAKNTILRHFDVKSLRTRLYVNSETGGNVSPAHICVYHVTRFSQRDTRRVFWQ